MMMMRIVSAAILVGLVASSGHSGETKFALSGDNTKITFVGTKPGGKHDGGFKKVTGTASCTGMDLTSLKISVEIDMDSTWTDTTKLTAHLKSPDFFGVASNPKSKFVSTKVEKSGDGYTITGKLTLNGRTKDLSFPAKIELGAGGLTVNSSFKINRHDWGISYGKGKVNDDVS